MSEPCPCCKWDLVYLDHSYQCSGCGVLLVFDTRPGTRAVRCNGCLRLILQANAQRLRCSGGTLAFCNESCRRRYQAEIARGQELHAIFQCDTYDLAWGGMGQHGQGCRCGGGA